MYEVNVCVFIHKSTWNVQLSMYIFAYSCIHINKHTDILSISVSVSIYVYTNTYVNAYHAHVSVYKYHRYRHILWDTESLIYKNWKKYIEDGVKC